MSVASERPSPPAVAVAARWTAWAPAVVWIAGRLLTVATVGIMAAAKDRSLGSALSAWDGHWLLSIASHGYVESSELAFFPGYPLLVSGLSRIVAVPAAAAGWIVSALAGIVFAYGLVALMSGLDGGTAPGRRRAGLLLVALISCWPVSVVFAMTYTEPLFCALAVWALVAVRRADWPAAGILATGAGLVRPTGVAVIAVVVVAAGVAGRRSPGRVRWRAWGSAALAPAGLVGYLAFVAASTGSIAGWFEIQRAGWNTGFDGGAATARFVWEQLGGPWSLMEAVTALALLLTPVAVYCCFVVRLPWTLTLYAVTVVAMAVGSAGVMNSKIRLLLPAAMVLLMPVAMGLSRRRTGTQIAVVVGAALVAAWFGAYCLLIYRHAI